MLKKKIRSYQRTFQKYGLDARALQYRSEKSAKLRYRELTADLDFEGKTILDIGCGFADIIPLIKKQAKKFEYTGVDMVPEFIEVVKGKYPEYKFYVRDYFYNPMKSTFDIIITSGTLNSNIKNAQDFRKRAIKIMFMHTKEAVAFNMAGGNPQPKNKRSYKVYYVDSMKIIKFCLSLTSKLIIRHHYHSKDFTVVMYK